MAGPHAEAVARQYPRLTAGLVLVDSSVEWRAPGQLSQPDGWARLARTSRWLLARRPVEALARLVVGGPLGSRTAARLGVSASMRDELVAVLAQPDTQAMTVAEFGGYNAQIEELYAIRARHPWPRVPTEVLTAGQGTSRRQLADQVRLARLLGAAHEVVDAGHNMMLNRPQTVVDSIDRVGRAG
jgi:pimeloyl-ACP methyl ester carboxylesterase